MYPAKFDYYRASSVDEALSLLQQHGGNAKILAGGHSLLPMMKMRLAQPPVLIDIGQIPDLRFIQHNDDGSVRIGAMTTYAEIAADERLQQSHAALTDACAMIGDVQVRNRGTLGGNLAHNDPASDLPAVALALDATIHALGPNGARTVGAEELIVGLMETSLAPNEVVTAIEFPAAGEQSGSAYEKFENPASGYAICGVAAYVSGGTARVAVTGALDHARRLAGVENALGAAGMGTDDSVLEQAAAQATDGLNEWDFMGDIHADAEYRAHLMRVLTHRALKKAMARAGNQ